MTNEKIPFLYRKEILSKILIIVFFDYPPRPVEESKETDAGGTDDSLNFKSRGDEAKTAYY